MGQGREDGACGFGLLARGRPRPIVGRDIRRVRHLCDQTRQRHTIEETASKHHSSDARHVRQIGERIGVEQNEVGPPADGNRADLLDPSRILWKLPGSVTSLLSGGRLYLLTRLSAILSR